MGRRHEPQEALGRAIRQLRDERGLQQDIADAADVNVTAISHIERGRANPAWRTVKRIAGALDVPLFAVALRAERLEQEG